VKAEAIDLGLRLAVVLENFWVTRDPYGAIGLFERLLASEGAPPTLRARALRACAGSYHVTRRIEQAESLYQESLALYEALGDERGAAIARYRLGQIALDRGNTKRARWLLEDSLHAFRSLGSDRGEAQAWDRSARSRKPKATSSLQRSSTSRARACAKRLAGAGGRPQCSGAWPASRFGQTIPSRRQLELGRRS
jgi:Tetratricopeptide repeat